MLHVPIGGRFPDYRRIIPAEAKTSLRIDAAQLVAALRRCMAIDDSAGRAVRIKATPGELRLYAVQSTTGETAESVPATSERIFPLTRGLFRASYLMDLAQRVRGEVELRFPVIAGNVGLWVEHPVAPGETFEYVSMGLRESA